MRIVLVALLAVSLVPACGAVFSDTCGEHTKCVEPPPDGVADPLGDAGRFVADAATDEAVQDAGEGVTPRRGAACNGGTCASDEVCVPGCSGVCQCLPMPDSGTCENGPCNCGAAQGCAAPPPPAHCEKEVPGYCNVEYDGSIRCACP